METEKWRSGSWLKMIAQMRGFQKWSYFLVIDRAWCQNGSKRQKHKIENLLSKKLTDSKNFFFQNDPHDLSYKMITSNGSSPEYCDIY